MKRTLHRLRRRGPVDRRVSIRAQHPWYVKAVAVLLLLALGYGVAYWQQSQRHAAVSPQGEAFVAQIAGVERQLQLERATRDNIAKEMALLQDENMRLREDVAFYKGIMSERSGAGALQLQRVQFIRGGLPGEYRYRIALVQRGGKGKAISGSLRLAVQGVQQGRQASAEADLGGTQKGLAINFKQQQQLEGVFSLPATLQAQSLRVEFFEDGDTQPSVSQAYPLAE